MKMAIAKDKLMQWTAVGLGLLLVLAAAAAVMMSLNNSELEASLSQLQADMGKTEQANTAARNKLLDDLKAANAKSAALEKKQGEADKLKLLLTYLEPQLAVIMEAAGKAKTSKPDVRAAALSGLGVIGQVAHGTNNEAALALLDRALAIDNANCVASLAINLGGAKKIDVAPECAALLPVAAPASEAKPAVDPKPAAEAKPAPAAGTAQPAAKG